MTLSGWCGERGKPNCKACRSTLCACRCHGTNQAQNKALRPVETVRLRENEASPNGAQTPPGSDRTFLSKQKGGLVL